MSLVYADASALVKLVLEEPESRALRRYLTGADVVSSAMVLAEVPRAVRRAAADDPRLPLELVLERAAGVLDALAFLSLTDEVVAVAGALAEPGLRALDAIHVASAGALVPLDAFLSYDRRQSAAARLAGLRTVSPGVP